MRGVEQIPWLYDSWMWLVERFGLVAWRRWLVGGTRGRTLEVGSGTGRNLPLYPAGVRVFALELDLATSTRARRRAPDVPLVCGSAQAMPFKAGVFDTVVSSLLFCSVPDPLQGLSETKRVLAEGGELRMLEHVRSTGPWGGRVDDAIQPLWTVVAGGCHPNRKTEETVEAAGFELKPEGRRAKGRMRRFVAVPQRR
ncbi:MAG: class I SAM-dependent methyltransferase [Myxococcaceae bacterium]